MDRPIILNAAMVRAVLSGQKTQTRRPVKGNPPGDFAGWPVVVGIAGDHGLWVQGSLGRTVRCPFGRAGDRLWVRETWQHYQNTGQRSEDFDPIWKFARHCFYQADESNPRTKPISGKWRPSYRMPRWASRITLPLISVRVERVQDISEADAWAEGYGAYWQKRVKEAGADGPLGYPDARGWFAMLWDELYGTWAQNPWVWVAEWKEIEVVR